MPSLQKIYNSVANLQEKPGVQNYNGRRDSQMLHGEPFKPLGEETNGWSRGVSVLDGYTGWVYSSNLHLAKFAETHVVKNIFTHTYPDPDFKRRLAAEFSFMSRVTVDATRAPENGFIKLQGRHLWVPESHLLAIDDLVAHPADIVDTAEMFKGIPYIYGGRTSQGLDCSGLVQIALQRNGVPCPRDADQQEPVVGKAVRKPHRGDIVYFKDGAGLHTGIMIDSKYIINATMRTMNVAVEKLDDMKKNYGGIKSIRRPEF